MLHPVVRWLARRAIRWFYRGAEFVNAGAIPASGPTLIVASHGNDLPDILMTFLATNRDVLFVANIAAADSLPVRLTYQGLGVIPVSRVRDARALKARGEDASALNSNAFVRVAEALKSGQVVAIFPEGNVPEHPCLGALRTGAAKMALQALDAGVTSLCMVPIGYQYENSSEPRSGLLAQVGTPVRVGDFRPTQESKRVTELTQFIRGELKDVTRNARTMRDATRLSTLAAAAGAALSSAQVTPIAASHAVQELLSRLSAADEVFVDDSIAPSRVAFKQDMQECERAIDTLGDLCVKYGAAPWSARDHADVLHAAGDVLVSPSNASAFGLWASSPLAAVAWAWHALPFWVSRTIAVRSAPTRMELAARTILPGLYFMEIWYMSVPLALWFAGVPGWLVLLLFVVQPRLGDFAVSWRDRYRTLQLVKSVQTGPDAERRAVVEAAVDVRSAWRALNRVAESA